MTRRTGTKSAGLIRRFASCPLLASVALLTVAAGSPQTPRARMVLGAPLYEVLAPDAIPAIDTPRFVPADKAREFMRNDEPVLGVTDGRVAKCYSTWLLERHEIVNDYLGDVPIAAEW